MWIPVLPSASLPHWSAPAAAPQRRLAAPLPRPHLTAATSQLEMHAWKCMPGMVLYRLCDRYECLASMKWLVNCKNEMPEGRVQEPEIEGRVVK